MLDAAERGRGRCTQSFVGCVLVKEGEIIAEGWRHLGGLHAEQMAIHDAEAKESPRMVQPPM